MTYKDKGNTIHTGDGIYAITAGLDIVVTHNNSPEITPENTMEHYSKEFWQQCLKMHPPAF